MDNVSPVDEVPNSLPEGLLGELRQLLRGQVLDDRDAEFGPRTTIFNGNVKSPARCCALPADAADVSQILKFCTKHGLFPSIKAGGYGTAGWSINGDIVVDLSNLGGIDIEPPSFDGGFTSLRDTPMPDSKGKEKIRGPLANYTPVSSNPGKRRRSPPSAFESGLPRNPLVANFLLLGDNPSPAIRRRIDSSVDGRDHPSGPDKASIETGDMMRQTSDESNMSLSSPRTAVSPFSTFSAVTSPSTTSSGALDGEESVVKSDDAVHVVHVEAGLAENVTPESIGQQDKRGVDPVLLVAPTSQAETSTGSLAADVAPSQPPSAPSFSVRSADPFGYMSAAPGLSSSLRPQRNYVQPVYQRPASTSFTPAGLAASSSGHVPASGGLSVAHDPFTAEGSPGSAFMSSNATPLHANAFVTFGAGMKQKDIDIFTAAHPLPATSPSGNTSYIAYHVPFAAHPVGSSVMMLGGFGFLSRLHGLSIDALVEVEMVLADGTIIFVSEKKHPDLWWALRGAGPAFGVVTRYKSIAYPVPVVFAGNLIYDFHQATAPSLIKHFRDCVKAAPRELYANVLLTAGPADKGSLIVVQLCYIGAQEKGKEFLQAIESWDGAPCLLNEVSEKSFLHQQDSVAQILRGKPGRQWFIRSLLITSLPDDVIHKTVDEFANTPIGCTWLFELAGGAVGDAKDTCLPKSQREAGFTIAAFHQWELDDDDPLCVETAEHWIYETLAPVGTGGPYPAFLGRHEPAERVMACYGENWKRLREIKRKYDPRGLFKHTLWPLDADENVVESQWHEPPSP
ncbi:hypothetical protein M0805_009200 [Coniferiporia weirii]|nr:hypothetical protein M0805_009200 [Coniferiporia weirii]